MPVFLDLPNGGCVRVDAVVSISPYCFQTGKQVVRVSLVDDIIDLDTGEWDSPQKVAEQLRAQLKLLCAAGVCDGDSSEGDDPN